MKSRAIPLPPPLGLHGLFWSALYLYLYVMLIASAISDIMCSVNCKVPELAL